MLLRIISTLVVLIAMVLAPYWLFVVILLLACIINPLYLEGAVIALLHDSFFSATDGQLFGFRSITFLISVGVIFLVYIVHTVVRKRI